MVLGKAAKYANKVVVVTGGASGLGAAFSRALTANGAYVVVADVRGDKAAETAAAIGAEAAQVDVSDPLRSLAYCKALSPSMGRWIC